MRARQALDDRRFAMRGHACCQIVTQRDTGYQPAVGLLLQWLMSILIAGCAAIAGLRLPILRKRWIAAGAVYGVVVIFLVMNYVVLPLSLARHSPHFIERTLIGNLLAMLLFGLILAFFVRDASPRASNGSNG